MVAHDDIEGRLDLLERGRAQDMSVILTRFDDLDVRVETLEKVLEDIEKSGASVERTLIVMDEKLSRLTVDLSLHKEIIDRYMQEILSRLGKKP